MKKVCFLLLAVITVHFAHAQLPGSLDKAKAAATAAGFDVNKLTSSIMGKLTPSLGLTDTQKPGVTGAVSSYLTGKSNILSLQQSNPTAYTQQQSGLFSTLKSKLTGILTAGQLTKFMGLKPSTNSATNVLSQLFF